MTSQGTPLAVAPAAQNAPASPEPSAQVKPVDAQWSCKTAGINPKGDPEGELPENLSVGTKFFLLCEGPQLVLSKDHLSLELPKDAKYALRLLETKSLSDTKGEFVATSWMSGEIKLPNLILTDGTKRLSLGNIKFDVSTVVDAKTNPESKPYPPWTVLSIPIPIWVWGVLGFAFLIVVSGVALRFRSSLRRRKLLKMLEQKAIALSPYNQFNKDLRKLSREIPSDVSGWQPESEKEFFRNLDEMLRWFLARELVIQTFHRKPTEIANDLKRVDKGLFNDLRRDLVITLSEVEKATAQAKRVSVSDTLQILELTRGFADRVHKAREAK